MHLNSLLRHATTVEEETRSRHEKHKGIEDAQSLTAFYTRFDPISQTSTSPSNDLELVPRYVLENT